MKLGTGGTFGSLFLEVTAEDARALPGPELDLRWTVSNDWGTPMVVARGDRSVIFQTDEQSDAVAVAMRVPWSLLDRQAAAGRGSLRQRLGTTVETRLTAHWGGWTDRPIEAWHRLVRSETFQRPRYPRDDVRVALRDAGTGEGIGLGSRRVAVGDLIVRTQLLLADGGTSADDPARARWGVSARLDLKAPLGRPGSLGGSGGWDAGAALLGTTELAPWATAHALVAAVGVSPLSASVPLQPRTWRYFAELSLALRAGSFTLLVEDRVATAIFEGGWRRVPSQDGADFKSSGYYGAFLPQNRVSVGLRRGRLTFWLSEDWTPGGAPHAGGGDNWFYDSNAPDVALGLAYASSL